MTDDLVNRPSFYGFLQNEKNKELLLWCEIDQIFTNPDWAPKNIKPYDVVYSDKPFPISMIKFFEEIGLKTYFVIPDIETAISHWRRVLTDYYNNDTEFDRNPYFRLPFIAHRQNDCWRKAEQFKRAARKMDALERQYGSKPKNDLAYYQEY